MVGGSLLARSLRASASCTAPGVTAWRWPAVDIDWPHLRHVIDSGRADRGPLPLVVGKTRRLAWALKPLHASPNHSSLPYTPPGTP